VGLPNVALQYDFYHMQLMEGDLAGTVTPRIDGWGWLS
jgi:hydroxypyruvate isomerase